MTASKSTMEVPEFKLLSSSRGAGISSSISSQLTSAVEQAVASSASEDEIEGLLWRLWNAIIATASRTQTDNQQYLVNLLQDISARGELKTGQGQAITVWDKKVWTDLPIFGAAIREVFNNDDVTDEEEQTQWININAFLARLTVHGANGYVGGPTDFSLFGIWSLREALESQQNGNVPSYKLATAKTWIDVAGSTLQKFCNEERSYDGKLAAPGEAYSDKQWKGYNDERWKVWRSRLQDQR